MANVIPVKATFTSSTVTGLAEFQSGDTIDISTYLSASSITFAGDSGSDSASLGETLTIAGGTNITTAATSNTITINLDSNVVTETSTDTLTNKSIDLANNTITGTTAEFNTALSDGSFATLAGSETLTNKTISGSSNTLSNIANSSLTNSSITFAGDSGSDGASLGETLTVAGGTSISTAVTSNTVTINLGTIDASSTTISNIPNSSLSNSSITFAGDSGSDSASLGETLTISGTSNEIETAVTSNTVTIGLPDSVSITSNLTVGGNLTVNGTTTTINSTTVDVVNSFRFEGSTSDDYETNLTVVDPTADRTITLPNATGTVSLLDNTETLSNKTISTLTVTGQAHTITDTTSGSSAGPELRLVRDITGADANYIGQLLFVGDSDTGVSRNYAKITGKIGDASNGTEDGIIEIAHIKGGSQNINVRMTSTEFKIMNGTDFDVETHDGSSNGLRLGNTLVTATAAELNHSDGVTSNIQTQLDAKATNAFAIAQAVALG